jgi:CRISPR-associated protein Cas1
VTGGDGRKSKVPLNALESIALLGHAQVTGEVLTACAESHVRLVALTRGGRVRFMVGSSTGGNVHLRLAQYAASIDADKGLAISRAIVAGKIQNSRRVLQQWMWDAERLERTFLSGIVDQLGERIGRVRTAVDGDHARGIEGDSARLYFQGLGHHLDAKRVGLQFLARTRRPPRDPVNALLSFGYTLLVAKACGALETVGLDPQVGFLHGLRPGRPSLALDLIEELRPVVADRFAVTMLARRQLTGADFVVGGGGACYMSDEGRRTFLDAFEKFMNDEVEHPLLQRTMPRQFITSVQATLMARHLRGDLAAYPPFLMAT